MQPASCTEASGPTPFILKAAMQGWRTNSSTSFKTQSRFFHFSMWMVLSIFSLRKKACYVPMTDSTLSKALYKAQKFGAQYAWQRPRLKGKSREKTWGSWFCWKEIKQQSIFPKFNKRSGIMSMAECVESMRSDFQSLFLQVSTCVIPSSSQNVFCLTFSSVQQDKIYDARTLNTSAISILMEEFIRCKGEHRLQLIQVHRREGDNRQDLTQMQCFPVLGGNKISWIQGERRRGKKKIFVEHHEHARHSRMFAISEWLWKLPRVLILELQIILASRQTSKYKICKWRWTHGVVYVTYC